MAEVNEKAVALALNPEEGAPFEYGGKKFTLQFLTGAGEDALMALVEPRIRQCVEEGKTSQRDVMNALRDVLGDAVFVILSDYDKSVSRDWYDAVRAKSLRYDRYAILAAVFEVQDMGKLLSDHLLIDAHLSAAGGKQA